MFEEDTQKREQVTLPPSSADTDKILPVVDEILADSLFEERTRQYVQKYLERWNFSAAWRVDVVVVSKEKLPKDEGTMEWDWHGSPYARLTIRRDIPEEIHEWVVAHEMMELFTRKETMWFHATALHIEEPLQSELLRSYYRDHNTTIEESLSVMFGYPRPKHLCFDQKEESSSVAVPSLSIPPERVTNPITPLPEVHFSFQTEEIPVEELLQYEDDPLLGESEPLDIEIPVIAKGVKDKKNEENQIVVEKDDWLNSEKHVALEKSSAPRMLLDDMNEEDQQILAHLHELGSREQPSFFSSKTQMVLPTPQAPLPSLSDVSSSSRQSSQGAQQARSPFSTPRLTPLQEQNSAWTLETIHMPVVSLPVKQKNTPESPKKEAQTPKLSGKSAWEALVRLAHRG